MYNTFLFFIQQGYFCCTPLWGKTDEYWQNNTLILCLPHWACSAYGHECPCLFESNGREGEIKTIRIVKNKLSIIINITRTYKSFGGIPYTAHEAQITPPPLFFIFKLIFGLVRLGKGLVYPAGL